MNVLFVTTHYPYPAQDGITLPAANLVKELSKTHKTTLGYFEGKPEHSLPAGVNTLRLHSCSRPQQRLRPFIPRGLRRFWSRQARTQVAECGADVVIAHRLHTAYACSTFQGRSVIIVQDLISPKVGQYLRSHPLLVRATALQYRVLERLYLTRFEAHHVVSPDEAKLVRFHHQIDATVSPNGVRDWPLRSTTGDPDLIGYYGNLRSTRNQEALVRLMTLLPDLKSKRPNLLLRVVGAGADSAFEKALIENPSIDYIGACDDPLEHLVETRVLVNPQREASGMKNSVAEPLTAGIPVVMTPAIASGLAVAAGSPCIADTDEQFVKVVLLLLEDDELAAATGRALSRHVSSHFSWSAYADALMTP